MRIISRYHDYYDCMQAQGQDLTCTWVRELEAVSFSDWPFPRCFGFRSCARDDNLLIEQCIVGFCGKIYPVLEVRRNPDDEAVLCHSLDDVDAFVQANYKAKLIDVYEDKKRFVWRNAGIGVRRSSLREFFVACRQKQSSYESIFVENGCPVFVARRRVSSRHAIVFHGRRDTKQDPVIPGAKYVESVDTTGVRIFDLRTLKDLQFYRLFPTQQAFQEIHMYLSGVLGFSNPHVPEPDDVTMRDIKGFDKWSFKKEPTKKRR